MKKIFVSLLMAMPLVASAQTSFTVESNGKKYAFPLEGTTITVTDDKITLPAEAPVYKSNLKSVSLFGMATSFQFKGMSLIADYMWAGKLMPKANNTFKFQATTNTGSDLYFGPEGDANAPIAVSVLQPKEALSSIPPRVVISRIQCSLSSMSVLPSIA